MARKPLADRIAAHEAKMARDRARLGLLKGREKSNTRKRDNRRKILIGAAVVGEIERDPEFRRRVMQLLHVALVRPIDREVLSDLLPERSHPPAANSDRPPVGDAEAMGAGADASAMSPPDETARILVQLDELIGDRGIPDQTTRRAAEG